MDAFEENLQTFGSTVSGPEMKESLRRCFDLIYVMMTTYSSKLKSMDDKISKLEKKGSA